MANKRKKSYASQHGGMDRRTRERAMKALENARRNVRQAKKIYDSNLIDNIVIPSIRDIERMPTQYRKEFLANIRTIRKPDAVKLKPLEGGALISPYRKRELEIKASEVERNKRAIREKANISTFSGSMGTEIDTLTRPRDYDLEGSTQSDLDAIARYLDKRTEPGKAEKELAQFKKNYLKALEKNFNSWLSPKVRKIIKDMDEESVYAIMQSYDDLTIQFIYDEKNNPQDIYEAWESRFIEVFGNPEGKEQ